ncbi:hypothetical protein PSTT_14418 [Puccinia striiformis]|uniref:Uncharacterized protein n=1 Tax=Puccinia striiformis TaxID=27350 RepID=A0A2S4UMG2_9BASI|nr:hypothetical protein PSTT_14418 [Puccinia striiformis]
MFSNPLVFVSFICLLARSSFALLSCNSNAIVDKDDCLRALHQIVYKADHTLGTDSKRFSYIYGNCSIAVSNDYGASRGLIQEFMNQQYQKRVRIFDQCAPHTGAGTVPAAETLFLSVGNRLTGGDAPYNSNFPFLKPTRAQRECTSHHKGGLLELYGELSSPPNDMSGKILKTNGTCTVYLSTSDGSKIVATDANLLPLFKRTFDVCNGEVSKPCAPYIVEHSIGS